MTHIHRLRAFWFAAVPAALLIVAGIVLAGRLLAQGEEPSPRAGDVSTVAVGSGFAYQGRIDDESGDPITDNCDLRFSLFAAATGGAPLKEVTHPNHPVAGGLFAVSLDFGEEHFRGEARWLGIAVRCPAGSGDYKTSDERQALSAVPYALSLRPGARIIGSLSSGVAGLGVINTSANFPVGLFGEVTATSGQAIGVAGRNASPEGFAVHGYSVPGGVGVRGASVDGRGVWGSSVSNVGTFGRSEDYEGVRGESVNSIGVAGYSTAWVGVYGFSETNEGVQGRSANFTGVAGYSTTAIGTYGESDTFVGVWGRSDDSTGVRGESTDGIGVHGSSVNGLAARFDGKTQTEVLEITGGADLAERFEVSGDATAEPGTIMVIDPDNPGHLTPATTAYDRKVAGVVSGAGDVATALVLHQAGVLEGDAVVAIAGRVYVRAEALSSPITPGDMLTTSDLPGYAMAATDHDRAQGAVIGKAMTGLESGTGLVLVLVNLQ